MPPKEVFSRKRSIYDFLSSTRLTILLCIILATESIVGSFTYRGDTSFEGGKGFGIFNSPLFLIPVFLLATNVFLCTLKRVVSGNMKGRVPLILAHTFLIFAMSGLMIDGRFGDIYTGYFPFNLPSRAVYNWREAEDTELPFMMEVSEFTIYRYPYLLKVGVKQNPGGDKIGIFVVKEGEALRIHDTGLVLRKLAFDPDEKKIHFEAVFRGKLLGSFVAGKEGSPPLGGNFVVVPVAFRDFGVKNMVARMKIVDGDDVFEYDVSPNHPAVYRGMNISLIESGLDEYKNLFIGIQITRKPGELVFWTGTIGFFLCVVVHFTKGYWGKSKEFHVSSPEISHSDLET